MSKLTAHLLMLIAAFIWGTTFVAQTTGMDTIGPITFTTARYFIEAIVLLPLAFYERRKLDLMFHLREDGRLRSPGPGAGRDDVWRYCPATNRPALHQGGKRSLSDRTLCAGCADIFVAYSAPACCRADMAGPAVISCWLLFSVGTSSLLSQWGDFLVAVGALFWAGHIILISLVMVKLKRHFSWPLPRTVFVCCLACCLLCCWKARLWLTSGRFCLNCFMPGCFLWVLPIPMQMMAQRYASMPHWLLLFSRLNLCFAALSGWLLLDQGLSLIAVSGCGLIFAAIIIADVFPDSWFRRPASSAHEQPQPRLT